MVLVHVVTHPEVDIDPEVPVAEWELSQAGLARLPVLFPVLAGATSVWSSDEVKALQAARLIAAELRLSPSTHPGLAEIDRSATGYLPEPEFWANYQQFLELPDVSAHGWETAHDAQRRMMRAVDAVLADGRHGGGDVVLVTHGGVAALLMAQLTGTPVQRLIDQPGQGSYFSFDSDPRQLRSGWQLYEAAPRRSG
ncbi:MAG: histidine phosphatase family protein [Frankiales bacterium]|nr:histidine phosphatase family protein [Frankiales bacterium]